MNIKIETVKTANLEMDFFRFGHGPKTFVILPGLSIKSVMESADTVASQYSAFNDEYTTYLFDRRKDLPTNEDQTSGESSANESDDASVSGSNDDSPRYTIADMARDTAEAIRALGLSDIYLFGASQGGMIALTLTIENPDLVSKLALGSTTAKISASDIQISSDAASSGSASSDAASSGSASGSSVDASSFSESTGNSDEIANWVDLAKAGDAKTLYREFGRKLYPTVLFEQYKEVLEGLGNFVTSEDLRRFIVIAEGTTGFDVSAFLSKITCPVLVLGSEDDRVIDPQASRDIAGGLVNAKCELHMYDGFGHAAFDTAPDYKERLLRFFAEEA